MGHNGHGVVAARSRGGCGRSSNCLTLRALTNARAGAIGAGVAAADDHHATIARVDAHLEERITGEPAILRRQEIHRQMDSRELATRDV